MATAKKTANKKTTGGSAPLKKPKTASARAAPMKGEAQPKAARSRTANKNQTGGKKK